MDIFRHHLLLLTDTLFTLLCIGFLLFALMPVSALHVRRAEVTEALNHLHELRLQAEIIFAETGRWPDAAQLRFADKTKYVAQLDVFDFQLVATMKSRSPELNARTLSLQAVRSGTSGAPRLLWLCGHARAPAGWTAAIEDNSAAPAATRTTIAHSDLPAVCR